jgi:small subunit ribosomal protein S4
MAIKTAQCRRCRSAGLKLYLKGETCYSPTCTVERRPYPPGEHGQGRQSRRRISDYGLQLREKQKLRRIYFLGERQFRSYFDEASRRKGVTGEALLQLLERRLDNVVFRLGFASSRNQSRQLVCHGHFTVNGKKADIPSHLLRPGDLVALEEKSRSLAPILSSLARAGGRRLPEWLALDQERMEGRLLSLPTRDQIDTQIEEQAVVEFYSR